MKVNSALYVWGIVAIFIIMAGCTSSGDNSNPTATVQSPSIHASTNHPTSLTAAQKDQAISIVKADTTGKDVLGRQGYSVKDVLPSGNGYAMVYIEGGSTVHSDGSIWTPDMYQMMVDLNSKKVTGVEHIEPKLLPTPTPTV